MASNGFVIISEVEEDLWRVVHRSKEQTKDRALTEAFPEGPPDERVMILHENVWQPGRAVPKQALVLEVEDE